MTCFIFHDYEWEEVGSTSVYCNLMGGCGEYQKVKGTCKKCGAIKYKLIEV